MLKTSVILHLMMLKVQLVSLRSMPGHFSAIIDMLLCLMFIDPAKVASDETQY